MNVGHLVEDLKCNGFGSNRTLSADERRAIVEYMARFEECSYSQQELSAMTDSDLVNAAYFVMAEYASGQI